MVEIFIAFFVTLIGSARRLHNKHKFIIKCFRHDQISHATWQADACVHGAIILRTYIVVLVSMMAYCMLVYLILCVFTLRRVELKGKIVFIKIFIKYIIATEPGS